MMPHRLRISNYRLRGAAILPLFLSLARCSGGPSGPAPPAPAAMRFTPATATPPALSISLSEASKTSTSITLNVVAKDLNNAAGVFFDLTFTPTVASVASAAAGPFLASNGGTVTVALPVDLESANAAGRVPVGFSLSPAVTGVGGSGIVGTLTLNGLASGTTNLSFEAFGVTTPFPVTTIPGVTFSGGTLTVNR